MLTEPHDLPGVAGTRGEIPLFKLSKKASDFG